MPLPVTAAFNKHQVSRADGNAVLPRSRIAIAGIEAGYNLQSPVINDAVSRSQYPGQLTREEFIDFCELNKSSYISLEDLAKSVVIVAPSNVITRASLEKIFNEARSNDNPLSEDEIDELFNILDNEHKGAFTADYFMQALYGDEGSLCLAEQRANNVLKAKMLKDAEHNAQKSGRNSKPIKNKTKACC
ncbi:unnamed protein product [Phytomonas sp. Hart1]|nr:unnamed protein product [Phytomonas sp. Hart1]|eukprot:CCW66333.1 unnamed protein product [Phytomonas sp. isolate Hart1]